MISQLNEKFNKKYSDLEIVQTTSYGDGKTFILAKSKTGKQVMDPFYVYDENNDKFYSYQPMANFDEFQMLLSKVKRKK